MHKKVPFITQGSREHGNGNQGAGSTIFPIGSKKANTKGSREHKQKENGAEKKGRGSKRAKTNGSREKRKRKKPN